MFFDYSNSLDQYLSVLISILLIIGNYGIGKFLLSKFFSDFKMGDIFFEFHYIVLGNILLNVFLQYLVFFELFNSIILKILGILIIVLGLFTIKDLILIHLKKGYNYFAIKFNINSIQYTSSKKIM